MSATYFTQCLNDCGMLTSSDSLTCQRRLESRLRCESTRINNFIEGFDEWIDINHCKGICISKIFTIINTDSLTLDHSIIDTIGWNNTSPYWNQSGYSIKSIITY